MLSTKGDISLYKITEALDKNAIHNLEAVLLKTINGGDYCQGMVVGNFNGYSINSQQLLLYGIAAINGTYTHVYTCRLIYMYVRTSTPQVIQSS